MLIDITRIYCDLDDFYNEFEEELKKTMLDSEEVHQIAVNEFALSPSEVMTIIIAFHLSSYRTFKHFYTKHVQEYWREAFPNLVSYPRFIALQKYIVIPLCAYLNTRKGKATGIAFVDSTPLIVCHNRRIHSHRVFKNIAKRGKNSVGWFFGFKLHLIVNDQGELLAFKLTAANVDDREPVPEMTKDLFGKLFGDKGYISQKLFDELFGRGLQLITKINHYGLKVHSMGSD